jgi:hypothetical protein
MTPAGAEERIIINIRCGVSCIFYFIKHALVRQDYITMQVTASHCN